MSRSDTDADMIDATRPKYAVGREVSFMQMHYSTNVLVGIVAKSRQIIRQNGAVQITYDINSSGMLFTHVPEENILKNQWPPRGFGSNGTRAGRY